uniref:ATP-dependent RNA helicase FANCM n=1 Tax=Leptobrachium leishanense TaxID=445787 RepID=A0A8C5Q7K5_9ANUR
MSNKQRTLFQSWGASLPPDTKVPKPAKPKGGKESSSKRGRGKKTPPCRPCPPLCPPQPACQGDDDDDVLLVAVYEAEKRFNQNADDQPGCALWTKAQNSNQTQDDISDQGQGTPPTTAHVPAGGTSPASCTPADGGHRPMGSSRNPGRTLSPSRIQNLPGFDLLAGDLWIYPTNYPIRDYQFSIAQVALLHNTLVCLPTGLGKTFIAAVVMYNFYRWYPSGKIIFMAPTKPLVAQQIEACFKVMGIPQHHMAEMTGNNQAQKRQKTWEDCRLFFVTPQILVNDLTRCTCPASDIKCLVIDEAHKAKGNHAYCQVVRELLNSTTRFRVLALSATPGSDAKSVQQVVSNLLIARIELRSEDSPDILPYSHTRQLEKFVVPLGEKLGAVQKSYLTVLETIAGRLIRNNVLYRRDIPNLSKYQIILSRDQFRKNPPSNIVGLQLGMIEGDFALCISLYHGYELLLQMGTRSLYHYLCSIMDGSKGMTRARNELAKNSDFMELYRHLENLFSDSNTSDPGTDETKPFIYSHPKLKKLEEIVVRHFECWPDRKGPGPSEDTRVMIFSSFRDSVQEIADMLGQHHPTVRVMTFVGHSSSGKNMKGFTQKEQLEVVKRFREGGYNTLVSTCVGEEGLDIGEVDLIICFDAPKSPIRLVQRMGRTGRKRKGRIVVILCEGREERMYNQSQSSKKSLYKAVSGNNHVLQLSTQSPRMVPDGVNPRVHKMFLTQGTYETKESVRPITKDRLSSHGSRKSALFNEFDTLKDGQLLTPRQYEVWKQRYRLRESDGVTDVLLPKTEFELFKESLDEAEEPEAPGGDVRKLSLTEWRVWQDQTLPTHRVDHSDRCQHFIAAMKMMELMRFEEGECSYEVEMKSYLHKEDPDRAPRTKKENLTRSVVQTKPKKPLAKGDPSERPRMAIMAEPDEDFVSTLKSTSLTKPSKSHPSCLGDVDTVIDPSEKSGDNDHLKCVDVNRDQADQDGFCEIEMEDRCSTTSPEPDMNSVLHRHPGEPQSLADSGCMCPSDNSSPSSNLFYNVQSPVDHFVFAEFHDEKEHENLLLRAREFLSRSPPPIGDLDSLFDSGDDGSCPWNLSLHKKRQLVSSPPVRAPIDILEVEMGKSQTAVVEHLDEEISSDRELDMCAEPIETPAQESENNTGRSRPFVPSEERLPDREPWPEYLSNEEPENAGKVNDPESEWDDLFESDCVELENGEVSPTETNGASLVQEERNHVDPTSDCLDLSRDLFEDDLDQEFSSSRPPGNVATKGYTSVTFNMFDPSIVLREESMQNHDVNEVSEDGERHKELQDEYDCSEELFSLNFDLGFSIDDDDADSDGLSESDAFEALQIPILEIPCVKDSFPTPPKKSHKNVIGGNMSTPLVSLYENSESVDAPENFSFCSPLPPPKYKFSLTPQKHACSPPPLSRATKTIGNPKTLLTSPAKRGLDATETPRGRRNLLNLESYLSSPDATKATPPSTKRILSKAAITIERSPDSEDEVVIVRRKRKLEMFNVLKSPETPSSDAESVSQLHAVKRHKRRHAARQFLDDEAEESSEGAEFVSSDEDMASENERDTSLVGFLNDDPQLSQALNDSEMHGVYLKSVRSLAFGNRFNMLPRRNRAPVFSQIPEQDEGYMEDSFCVEDEALELDVEEGSSEDDVVNYDLLQQDSFVDGKKQYCTRRRLKLKDVKSRPDGGACPLKRKTRIVIHDDSSEEETGPVSPKQTTVSAETAKPNMAPPKTSMSRPSTEWKDHCAPVRKVHNSPLRDRCQMRINLKAALSEELDFQESRPAPSKSGTSGDVPQAIEKADDLTEHSCLVQPSSSSTNDLSFRSTAIQPVSIVLADSREIASGPEVISCLKTVHKVKVEVCPLGGCDYIVSNRLAVERKSLSDFSSGVNRSKLVERVKNLQNLFERVCLIVEKDRVKPGETSRLFQRTKYYDSTLSALTSAGVQILFSSSQEETAGLLKELMQLEQRKRTAITVPTQVTGNKQHALRFYLSIPDVSYIAALNLCHHFQSVKQMSGSSVDAIAKRAQVSRQKAEEIYRYVHHVFEAEMLQTRH